MVHERVYSSPITSLSARSVESCLNSKYISRYTENKAMKLMAIHVTDASCIDTYSKGSL